MLSFEVIVAALLMFSILMACLVIVFGPFCCQQWNQKLEDWRTTLSYNRRKVQETVNEVESIPMNEGGKTKSGANESPTMTAGIKMKKLRMKTMMNQRY
uniref:Uncharacterized protein n=1 Tax=Heterorhabditis bacteriophora TaxID=37862 RepID=A0A1I7X909_HETBA